MTDLEEKIMKLKIKGYDLRRAIDLKKIEIQKLALEYNKIVEEIRSLATESELEPED